MCTWAGGGKGGSRSGGGAGYGCRRIVKGAHECGDVGVEPADGTAQREAMSAGPRESSSTCGGTLARSSQLTHIGSLIRDPHICKSWARAGGRASRELGTAGRAGKRAQTTSAGVCIARRAALEGPARWVIICVMCRALPAQNTVQGAPEHASPQHRPHKVRALSEHCPLGVGVRGGPLVR